MTYPLCPRRCICRGNPRGCPPGWTEPRGKAPSTPQQRWRWRVQDEAHPLPSPFRGGAGGGVIPTAVQAIPPAPFPDEERGVHGRWCWTEKPLQPRLTARKSPFNPAAKVEEPRGKAPGGYRMRRTLSPPRFGEGPGEGSFPRLFRKPELFRQPAV